LEALGGVFARGNEVKSLLAALVVVLVALVSLLGRSWPFLVVLGAVFDRSWEVLGRSWNGLWPSWAVLERSWIVLGRLGAVWGRLGKLKTLIFLVFFYTFCKIDVLNKPGHLGWS